MDAGVGLLSHPLSQIQRKRNRRRPLSQKARGLAEAKQIKQRPISEKARGPAEAEHIRRRGQPQGSSEDGSGRDDISDAGASSLLASRRREGSQSAVRSAGLHALFWFVLVRCPLQSIPATS